MGVIADEYEALDTDVSLEAFREAVEDKVEQMGGLADEETAAKLIAHELKDEEVNGIADIEPGMDEVKFLGKVVSDSLMSISKEPFSMLARFVPSTAMTAPRGRSQICRSAVPQAGFA